VHSFLLLDNIFIHLDNKSRLNGLEAFDRDNFENRDMPFNLPMKRDNVNSYRNDINGAQNRQQYQYGAFIFSCFFFINMIFFYKHINYL
jgi:hypothetical protein